MTKTKTDRDGGEADALLQKINVAVKAANEAQTELVSRSKEVGLLLIEARKLHPAVKDFEAFLKRVDGLHLSRAYECMRIAGGRATDEEIRSANRSRVKKHRAKKKLPKPATPKTTPVSVTVTETADFRNAQSSEISIEQRRAEHAAFETAEEKAEASKYALSDFVAACLKLLPQMTEADQLKALEAVSEMIKPKAEAA